MKELTRHAKVAAILVCFDPFGEILRSARKRGQRAEDIIPIQCQRLIAERRDKSGEDHVQIVIACLKKLGIGQVKRKLVPEFLIVPQFQK